MDQLATNTNVTGQNVYTDLQSWIMEFKQSSRHRNLVTSRAHSEHRAASATRTSVQINIILSSSFAFSSR